MTGFYPGLTMGGDPKSPQKWESFLVGRWQTFINAGAIQAYRQYSFFANGIFMLDSGSTASSTSPLTNSNDHKFVHSQMSNAECGTYSLNGNRLTLTWAENGARETWALGSATGDFGRPATDDTMRVNGRTRYIRMKLLTETPDIPASRKDITATVSLSGRDYHLPILDVDRGLLNQYRGLDLRLRTFGSHHLSLKINPETWILLFQSINRTFPVGRLTGLEFSATLRDGAFYSHRRNRSASDESGSFTLTGVEAGDDPATYRISIVINDLILPSVSKDKPPMTVNLTLEQISVRSSNR
jgi:hypothetical protein